MAPSVVQMRTAAETALIEWFEAEAPALVGAAEERAAAMERFKAQGLPGRRVESYHYTDLRSVMRSLAPSATSSATSVPAALFEGLGGHRLVFVDGRFTQDAETPAELTIQPLQDALKVGLTPGRAMGKASDVVVDLNTALMRDGAYIRVAGNTALPEPLVLDFIQTAHEANAILARVIIEVGAGSTLTIVETHRGKASLAYQSNTMVELVLGEGARVEHIRVNEAGDRALVLSTLAARLEGGSALSSLSFSSGGETVRQQSFITYAGENASLDLRGATMIRGRQHCDNTLVVDHAVPNGISRELFRTVADDEAHGVFQGKIIVRPHAQKTDGQMASNALLLGDEAAMSNKPELEIFADDVVCAHGATCGSLEESQLFYLMARGLPRPQAEALLVEAFLGEVLEAVSGEALRDSLSARISEWLAARQAA
ncbi:MAG: Fe-S cluster assembly protein SufD [Beijerinckiaceae bacterium]|nr:Fe-S cluster assembly protein SufD [Beijerinckiaceae bacterium]MCZ8299616.1 Fe-S cluster assembly protein SufD [Beijerinckiaceae bacterium]